MKSYTVTVLDKVFKEKAEKPYRAKSQAVERYLKGAKIKLPASFLISIARIKVDEKDDARVSFPLGKVPKEEADKLLKDWINSRLASTDTTEEEEDNGQEPEEY